MPKTTEYWGVYAFTEYGINLYFNLVKGLIATQGYMSVADFWLITGVKDKEFNNYVKTCIGWTSIEGMYVEKTCTQWKLVLPQWEEL